MTIFFFLLWTSTAFACSPMPNTPFESCKSAGVVQVHEATMNALGRELQSAQSLLNKIVKEVEAARVGSGNKSTCFNQSFHAMDMSNLQQVKKETGGKVCLEHVKRLLASSRQMLNKKSEELRFISVSRRYREYLKNGEKLKTAIDSFEKMHVKPAGS